MIAKGRAYCIYDTKVYYITYVPTVLFFDVMLECVCHVTLLYIIYTFIYSRLHACLAVAACHRFLSDSIPFCCLDDSIPLHQGLHSSCWVASWVEQKSLEIGARKWETKISQPASCVDCSEWSGYLKRASSDKVHPTSIRFQNANLPCQLWICNGRFLLYDFTQVQTVYESTLCTGGQELCAMWHTAIALWCQSSRDQRLRSNQVGTQQW